MKKIILAIILSITTLYTFANKQKDYIEVTYISGVKDTIEVSNINWIVLDKGDLRESQWVYASYVRSFRDITTRTEPLTRGGFFEKWKFVLLGISLILTILAYFFVRNKIKKEREAEFEEFDRDFHYGK